MVVLALVAINYGPVFAFIRQNAPDENAARDLTQEFFALFSFFNSALFGKGFVPNLGKVAGFGVPRQSDVPLINSSLTCNPMVA